MWTHMLVPSPLAVHGVEQICHVNCVKHVCDSYMSELVNYLLCK